MEEDEDTDKPWTTQSNVDQLNMLIVPSTYDMCYTCLQPYLGTNGQLEEADKACEEDSCPQCGVDKLWSKGYC
eukprot:15355665-Ditylum_brightwellii.AAC.1